MFGCRLREPHPFNWLVCFGNQVARASQVKEQFASECSVPAVKLASSLFDIHAMRGNNLTNVIGRSYTQKHGCFVTRACGFWGGVNLGKQIQDMHSAHWLPVEFYTFDTAQMLEVFHMPSIKEFAAAVVLSVLLLHGSTDNVIIGGLSLGSSVASVLAAELEGCMTGNRAMFALDARSLPPMPC